MRCDSGPRPNRTTSATAIDDAVTPRDQPVAFGGRAGQKLESGLPTAERNRGAAHHAGIDADVHGRRSHSNLKIVTGRELGSCPRDAAPQTATDPGTGPVHAE